MSVMFWQASPVSRPADLVLWSGGSAPTSCIMSWTVHRCPCVSDTDTPLTALRRAPSAPGQDHDLAWLCMHVCKCTGIVCGNFTAPVSDWACGGLWGSESRAGQPATRATDVPQYLMAAHIPPPLGTGWVHLTGGAGGCLRSPPGAHTHTTTTYSKRAQGRMGAHSIATERPWKHRVCDHHPRPTPGRTLYPLDRGAPPAFLAHTVFFFFCYRMQPI